MALKAGKLNIGYVCEVLVTGGDPVESQVPTREHMVRQGTFAQVSPPLFIKPQSHWIRAATLWPRVTLTIPQGPTSNIIGGLSLTTGVKFHHEFWWGHSNWSTGIISISCVSSLHESGDCVCLIGF